MLVFGEYRGFCPSKAVSATEAPWSEKINLWIHSTEEPVLVEVLEEPSAKGRPMEASGDVRWAKGLATGVSGAWTGLEDNRGTGGPCVLPDHDYTHQAGNRLE